MTHYPDSLLSRCNGGHNRKGTKVVDFKGFVMPSGVHYYSYQALNPISFHPTNMTLQYISHQKCPTRLTWLLLSCQTRLQDYYT